MTLSGVGRLDARSAGLGAVAGVLAAGVALGVLAPDFAKQLGLMSTVFLRLIRSIIAPLLFGTLVAGIAGAGGRVTPGPCSHPYGCPPSPFRPW